MSKLVAKLPAVANGISIKSNFNSILRLISSNFTKFKY